MPTPPDLARHHRPKTIRPAAHHPQGLPCPHVDAGPASLRREQPVEVGLHGVVAPAGFVVVLVGVVLLVLVFVLVLLVLVVLLLTTALAEETPAGRGEP